MKIDSDLNFEVLEFSDSRYERLTVEVQYKGEPVAQLNQEFGANNLELEFFANLDLAIFKLPLAGFLDALILAKSLILEEIY